MSDNSSCWEIFFKIVMLVASAIILALGIWNKIDAGTVTTAISTVQKISALFKERLITDERTCAILQEQYCDGIEDCNGGVDEDRCVTVPGGYEVGDIRVYNAETNLQLGICYDPSTWKDEMSTALCQLITDGICERWKNYSVIFWSIGVTYINLNFAEFHFNRVIDVCISYSPRRSISGKLTPYQGDPKSFGESYLGEGISITSDDVNLPTLVQKKPDLCSTKLSVKVICETVSQELISPSDSNARVVGGEEVDISMYPWQVGIVSKKGDLYCGGTFVGDDWVVTAAHCIKYPDIWNDNIIFGTTKLSKPFTDSEKLEIRDVRIYPLYNDRTAAGDVAVIKVFGDYQDKSIEPAVLPAPGQFFPDGTNVSASGWGDVGQAGETSENLNAVSLNFLNTQTCKLHSYYDNSVILDGMVCAGSLGKDTCKGDSGGPLIAVFDGTAFLVGVTSWGKNCGLEGYPGVYAEVSYYVDWITRTIYDIDNPEQINEK